MKRMEKIETPDYKPKIRHMNNLNSSTPKSTAIADTAFNQNVMDAQKEYEMKVSGRFKATVESGGRQELSSYTDSIMKAVNKASEEMSAGKQVLSLSGNTIVVKTPNNNPESPVSSQYSGIQAVAGNSISDVQKNAKIASREYIIEKRLEGHGIRAIRTYKGMVTGITRSAIRNEEYSGRGLTQLYDNGLEVAVRNPGVTTKIVAASTFVGVPGARAGILVANRVHKAIVMANVNRYAATYSVIESKKALTQVNEALVKNGYARLKSLDRKEINNLIDDVKGSGLSKGAKSELISTLKDGREWQRNLDFNIAKSNANQVLRRFNIQGSTLRGSALSIWARKQVKILERSGASQEAIDAMKQLKAIGDAETLQKTAKMRFKKISKFIKGIRRSFMRYMRQNDTGRGMAVSFMIASLTLKTLQKALKTVQTLARAANTVKNRLLLESLKHTEKALQKSTATIKAMNINTADPVIRSNKVTGRAIKRNERLQKRETKLRTKKTKKDLKVKKKEKFRNRLRDPFGLKARFSLFKRQLREKALRKVLGNRVYGALAKFFGSFAKVLNFVKGLFSKLIAYAAMFVLIIVLVVAVVSLIASIIGSFDLSGDSNYSKIKKYVIELYRDDLKFMASNQPFYQATDGVQVTPYGCVNIIFDNNTHISRDKYDLSIEEDTDEEFDHLASSNICEILSMTYIHFAQEFGEQASDTNAVDVFNDASYSDLRDYVTQLWRGSHHFEVTYTGSSVNKIKYTTYFYDELFGCELRSDRWITEIKLSGSVNSSAYSIWRELKNLGYSDYSAAAILGCWSAESNFNPYRIESDYLYAKTDAEKDAAVKTKDSLDTYTRDHVNPNYKDTITGDKCACGIGLAQWTAGRAWNILYYYDDEADELSADRSEAHENWMTLEYQLKYMTYEMTKGNYKGYFADFKDYAPSDEDDESKVEEAIVNATRLFFEHYEWTTAEWAAQHNCYDKYLSMFETRKSSALEVYQKYHNMSGSFYCFNQHGNTHSDKYSLYGDTSYTCPDANASIPSGYCGMCAAASIVSSFTGEVVTPLDIYNTQGLTSCVPHPDKIFANYGLVYENRGTPSYQEIIDFLNSGGMIMIYVTDAATFSSHNSHTIASGTWQGNQYCHWISLLSVINDTSGSESVLCSTSSWGTSDDGIGFCELELSHLNSVTYWYFVTMD